MNQLKKDSAAFFSRLNRVSRRCMEAVLEGKPKCHYPVLHRVVCAMEHCGSGSEIYVSGLSRALNESPQSVSRTLRILEQDGLVERCTDPGDRRKTMVRLTPLGMENHKICTEAVQQFGAAVAARLGPERLSRMHEDFEALLAAMEAEASEKEETHD